MYEVTGVNEVEPEVIELTLGDLDQIGGGAVTEPVWTSG